MAKTKCCALNCNNKGSHLFPRDPKRRKQWEKALGIVNFKAKKTMQLCKEHFKESDYFGKSKYTDFEPLLKLLKKTAVPSVFCFTKNKQLTPAATKRQQRCERRRQKKDPQENTLQSLSLDPSVGVKTEPLENDSYNHHENTSYINDTPNQHQQPDEIDDEDLDKTSLYIQFRGLTELVLNDAVDVNANGLKLLIRKAQEMITIVNNCKADQEDDLKEQNMLCKRPLIKKRSSPSAILEPDLVKKMKPIIEMTAKILKEKSDLARNAATVTVKNEKAVNEQSKQSPDPLSKDTSQKPSSVDASQNVGKSREITKVKRTPSVQSSDPLSKDTSQKSSSVVASQNVGKSREITKIKRTPSVQSPDPLSKDTSQKPSSVDAFQNVGKSREITKVKRTMSVQSSDPLSIDTSQKPSSVDASQNVGKSREITKVKRTMSVQSSDPLSKDTSQKPSSVDASQNVGKSREITKIKRTTSVQSPDPLSKDTSQKPSSVDASQNVGKSREITKVKRTMSVQSSDPLSIDTSQETLTVDTSQKFGKSREITEVKRNPRASAHPNRQSNVKKENIKSKVEFKQISKKERLSMISDPLSLTSNVAEIDYEVKEQENDCNILVLKV